MIEAKNIVDGIDDNVDAQQSKDAEDSISSHSEVEATRNTDEDDKNIGIVL